VTVDRVRRLLPIAVATAGVVGAHALNYVLAFPDPAVRSHELTASGHGYWPAAVGLAVVAGVLALGIGVGNGFRPRRSSTATPIRAGQLAAMQVLLFVAVESVERLGAGVDPLPFLRSPQFALGVLLQLAVAVGAVIVLRAVEAGTRRVARGLRRTLPRRSAAPIWSPQTFDVVGLGWSSSTPARAPPVSL
jgi:hypothetical protein